MLMDLQEVFSQAGILRGGLSRHYKKKVHSLAVILKDVKDTSLWAITNVHGLHSTRERHVLWQELKDFKLQFTGIWCVVGDFNLTRFASKRKYYSLMLGILGSLVI